jgi:hypothetical protein
VRAWKRIGAGIAGSLVVCLAAVTIWVERESDYRLERLSEGSETRALILYHPSRDARFSDDLSLAVARGFETAGLAVDRATLTTDTPEHPEGYAIVAVVSNTYFWTPDRPTRRYLERARLEGIPVIGLIGGAGATVRSQRLLAGALGGAGATILDVRSYWLLRPNDESRMDEPNRAVALDLAETFARAVGRPLAPRSSSTH